MHLYNDGEGPALLGKACDTHIVLGRSPNITIIIILHHIYYSYSYFKKQLDFFTFPITVDIIHNKKAFHFPNSSTLWCNHHQDQTEQG